MSNARKMRFDSLLQNTPFQSQPEQYFLKNTKNFRDVFPFYRILSVKGLFKTHPTRQVIHLTEDTFSDCVQQHSAMVYRVAWSALKHPADAEDVTQTVFYRLLTASKPFENEEHLKRWLIRVTLNECKMLFRAPWRSRNVPLDAVVEEGREDDYHENAQLLLDAVKQLPRKERVLVYLHYYEDYSLVEIAQFTGANPSTLRTRLMRARQKLKNMLQEAWNDDEP